MVLFMLIVSWYIVNLFMNVYADCASMWRKICTYHGPVWRWEDNPQWQSLPTILFGTEPFCFSPLHMPYNWHTSFWGILLSLAPGLSPRSRGVADTHCQIRLCITLEIRTQVLARGQQAHYPRSWVPQPSCTGWFCVCQLDTSESHHRGRSLSLRKYLHEVQL